MYAGTGIYTLLEASRLIDVQARYLRRWLYGYHYSKVVKGERVRTFSEPLWAPQSGTSDSSDLVIGFHDLLEIRFVRAFVKHGVPLIVVRRCLESARAEYNVDYPFTNLEFKTDGKTIFGEAVRKTELGSPLVDLKNRQLVFKNIITPSLYAGIEYDGKQARKWYPAGKRTRIVLDPVRQFGSPIVEDTGTPTDVLYASYLAEGKDDRAVLNTASSYEVPAKLVRSAIKFEESLKRTIH